MAGFDDRQVMVITLFVALRQAFSTVNDALGGTVPCCWSACRDAVREAVTFGRSGANKEQTDRMNADASAWPWVPRRSATGPR